jgi:hypothetical protein
LIGDNGSTRAQKSVDEFPFAPAAERGAKGGLSTCWCPLSAIVSAKANANPSPESGVAAASKRQIDRVPVVVFQRHVAPRTHRCTAATGDNVAVVSSCRPRLRLPGFRSTGEPRNAPLDIRQIAGA